MSAKNRLSKPTAVFEGNDIQPLRMETGLRSIWFAQSGASSKQLALSSLNASTSSANPCASPLHHSRAHGWAWCCATLMGSAMKPSSLVLITSWRGGSALGRFAHL